MNMYDKTQLAQLALLTEEQKNEIAKQFRSNLQYLEKFQGIPVYLQPTLTLELDIHDIASGYAAKVDVEGNGVETPIIILSETANTSSARNAILWHEHGHHALNHLDGKTEESERLESEELEADMWSYINNGPEIVMVLIETQEKLRQLYQQYTPTLEFFQEHNMAEYTPEELLAEALERREYSLNELDARIKALSI